MPKEIIISPQIFMDESEFARSDFTPDALRQVLNLDGPKCKDKLLTPRVDDE